MSAEEDLFVYDEYGNQMGYCNACGEEISETEDCCDIGEFEPMTSEN